MRVSRRFRSTFLALAAGSVPLVLALSLHGQPVPQSVTLSGKGSPQQVADDLDAIVQPRFQDVTAGQFGLTRLVPAVRGHQSVGFLGYFQTNTPTEAARLASANAAQRPYVMAFLHCVHVPGAPVQPLVLASPPPSTVLPRFSTIVVSSVTDGGYPPDYLVTTEPALRTAALRVLPSALKGKNAQTQSGEWSLFLRPVRASSDSCLTCHVGAKRGDTLGVMAYAVSNTVNKN